MAVQKGKQGTKGAKQIVEENVSTLAFYRNMGLGASGIYFVVMFLIFSDTMTGLIITMTILATLAHIAGYQFMAFMAKAKFSETGSIIDTGVDLNMEGGIAEHVKDLIILTTGTQLLALISNWFWLLYLLAPLRASHMLWNTVIKPWLSRPDESAPEVSEKKQKKMERKMKRAK